MLNVQRSTLNIERADSLNVEGWMLNLGRFSKRLAIAAIASSIAISSLAQNSPAPADQPRDLTVLILGDSLGLCGFSKRLDQKFRADPRVKSVFTYCTCGTNPLSWLKEKPYREHSDALWLLEHRIEAGFAWHSRNSAILTENRAAIARHRTQFPSWMTSSPRSSRIYSLCKPARICSDCFPVAKR